MKVSLAKAFMSWASKALRTNNGAVSESKLPWYVGVGSGYIAPLPPYRSKYNPHVGKKEAARALRFKDKHGHWPGNTF